MLSGAYASATATDTHKVAAFVGPAAGKTAGAASSITATGDVAVLANMDSSVLAEGFMVGIALGGSGSYAETTATATPTVQAYLGDQATIDADGDVDIKAVAEGDAIADGTGISVAVGVGYAGAEVTADLNPTVAAFTEGSGSIRRGQCNYRVPAQSRTKTAQRSNRTMMVVMSVRPSVK